MYIHAAPLLLTDNAQRAVGSELADVASGEPSSPFQLNKILVCLLLVLVVADCNIPSMNENLPLGDFVFG